MVNVRMDNMWVLVIALFQLNNMCSCCAFSIEILTFAIFYLSPAILLFQKLSGYPESNLLMISLTQPHLKFKEAGWTIPPSNQSILRLWEHLEGDTDGKAQ